MKKKNIFTVLFILNTVFFHPLFAQTKGEIQLPDSAVTTIVKVKGLTCSSDVKSIEANLEKLPGIKSFKAEKFGPTTKFNLTFNPALISFKEIYSAIEGTNGCENPNDKPYKVKQ